MAVALPALTSLLRVEKSPSDFSKFMIENVSIVLVRIAEDVGLDPDTVRTKLASGDDEDVVHRPLADAADDRAQVRTQRLAPHPGGVELSMEDAQPPVDHPPHGSGVGKGFTVAQAVQQVEATRHDGQTALEQRSSGRMVSLSVTHHAQRRHEQRHVRCAKITHEQIRGQPGDRADVVRRNVAMIRQCTPREQRILRRPGMHDVKRTLHRFKLLDQSPQ